MPDPIPNRPLWEVMHDAYDQSTAPSGLARDWADHHGYAAELRAIAEAIPGEFWDDATGAESIHDWLRAEADRAEAG